MREEFEQWLKQHHNLTFDRLSDEELTCYQILYIDFLCGENEFKEEGSYKQDLEQYPGD